MGKGIKNNKTIDIPTEIMEEILYKLPVKSLLRFKCVSKSWRSLISSKYFIKHHLKKSSTGKDTDLKDLTYDDNQFMIFKYCQTNFFSLGSCFLLDEPVFSTDSDYKGSVRIVGSFNGLILIAVYARYNLLLVRNPSTRKVKNILPPVSFGEPHEGRKDLFSWGDLRQFLFGLGYDEARDEYKVVCIKVPSCSKFDYTTHMYSSKSGYWKKIKNLDKGFPGSHTVFVSGRFHWLAKKGNGDCEIVSLDLVEEKYETMARPKCFSKFKDLYRITLVELGGYLSLMHEDTSRKHDTNIWAMMEYGKRESWTRVWKLSNFVENPLQRFIVGTVKPLCLKKNGDITVAFRSNVVVYNGKNVVHNSVVDMIAAKAESIVYVESLVSPFGSYSLTMN